MTPQQISQSYQDLSKPPGPNAIADFNTWVARWETRIAELEKANGQYVVHDPQRRLIAINCPEKGCKEARAAVESENRKGHLMEWSELNAYLVALSTSRQATEAGSGPAPMVMRAAEQPEAARQYTDQAWQAFRMTDDGVRYVKVHPDDAEAQSWVNAMCGKKVHVKERPMAKGVIKAKERARAAKARGNHFHRIATTAVKSATEQPTALTQ